MIFPSTVVRTVGFDDHPHCFWLLPKSRCFLTRPYVSIGCMGISSTTYMYCGCSFPSNPVYLHALDKTLGSSQSSRIEPAPRTNPLEFRPHRRYWAFLSKANPNWLNRLSLTQGIKLLIYCSYTYSILVVCGLETQAQNMYKNQPDYSCSYMHLEVNKTPHLRSLSSRHPISDPSWIRCYTSGGC